MPNFYSDGAMEEMPMDGTTIESETALLEDQLELVTLLLMLNLLA